jgi:hypothetical protein
MQPEWCFLPILAFRRCREAIMTTISAGAAAGLLVALMVLSTTDGHAAELQPANQSKGFAHPGDIKGFNPQPDPPRDIRSVSAVAGDGSV